jgi:dihydroneopterin aldolase
MKSLLGAFIGLVLLSGGAIAQDIDLHSKYTPTKSEWLDIQLKPAYDNVVQRNKQVSSIDYMVGDRYIDVYVICKKKLDSNKQKALEEELKAVSAKIFEKYDWSRHMDLRVEMSTTPKGDKKSNNEKANNRS